MRLLITYSVLLVATVAMAQPSDFVSVSAGAAHNCGRTSDGSVRCWGMSALGRLRVPDARYRQVSAGGGNACGIVDDGSLRCWGVPISNIPRTTPREGSFTHVDVGVYAACAIRADRRLVCWGGQPDPAMASVGGLGREVRQGVPEGEFTTVAVGHAHACALRVNGTAVCWGDDAHIGEVPGERFTALTAATNHTCGLRRDGRAACWGRGSLPGNRAIAEGRFSAIATGSHTFCGIERDTRGLRCFGGGWVRTNAPEGSFRSVSVNAALIQSHACAISDGGRTVCWGHRENPAATPPR